MGRQPLTLSFDHSERLFGVRRVSGRGYGGFERLQCLGDCILGQHAGGTPEPVDARRKGSSPFRQNGDGGRQRIELDGKIAHKCFQPDRPEHFDQRRAPVFFSHGLPPCRR